MSESYGLFYPLVAPGDTERIKFQNWLRMEFWNGDPTRVAKSIYNSIPHEERLKLKSFRYASAGYVEFAGILMVLLLLSRVARSYIQAGTELLNFLEQIEAYFKRHPNLRRPHRTFDLDKEMAIASNEALTLVFEIGPKHGFDQTACNKLIEIFGNPISALKFLTEVGKEGRKLAALQQAGLIHLQESSAEGISLLSIPAQYRRGYGIVEVQKVKRRSKKTND